MKLMKKIVAVLLISFAANGFSALQITQTKFRKAPLEVVVQSAEQDNPEAQLELALRYYAGHQVSQNASTAFLWMHKSAEQNHPSALESLSQMYAEGIGIPVDLKQAELWFITALATSPDNSRLKRQFEQLVKDKKESGGNADDFLKKCGEAGYAPAYLSLYAPVAANLYANGQYKEALPLLRKLSDIGDTVSTLHLAKIYAEGLGGLPRDAVQARVLYQQLANKEEAKAQYELAVMYENGEGGDADPRQAESLYKRSADQKNVDAQNRLTEIERAHFPYVLGTIKELYPKTKVRLEILSVEKNDEDYQNVAGDNVPGVLVRYERPPTSQAAGFSGIVLVGVELTNRETGARYWFSCEYLDNGPTYEYSCDSNLDLFVDQEFDPDAEITSWAVVYGHLLPDGRTIAVFDTREFKTNSLAELFERNRYSEVLTNRIAAKTLPQREMGGDLDEFWEDVEGNRGTIGRIIDILNPFD
jgi:TPR repeat protein